ncbi:MAG: 3-deoxy-7-phosphoheptulonate synthase [Spirochaetaceae bacterium]|jgi:3-deoxy-7-phosphoheptulonate synthase|nr:3-deoxy-7-phosphoheptulonate synthase [Spirochaetaceae bacterium]
MVIILQKNISKENKENIRSFLKANQLRVNEIIGEEDTIFGAVGMVRLDPRMVEVLPGVARVIPISKPYKMASREFKKENTIVEIRNNRGETIRIGGSKVVAIAGPCAVESREQMFDIARHVAASGAVMLRGGAFKPRTSPYAFQGLGEEGVRLLKEAGDAFGLPVVSEIVSADHLPVMLDYVDLFQIGARNMQNFELLKRVGETGRPVVLKRGLAATIEELLMAAEYLLAAGTDRVILCERGIRTFEQATRNTLDLSAIPILRGLTHLPIIVDPSHAVGIRDKITPMGLAAIAAGADGIIVEVHCSPERALSDGAQSLYPDQFDKLMRGIDVLAPVVGKEVARIRKGFAVSPGALKGAKPSSQPAAGGGEQKIPRGTKKVCAFMGAWGAWADQAVNRFFGDGVDEVNFAAFRDVFRAVSEGRVDYGMVPVENSLAGSVYDNYDNLYRFEDVRIVGAITLRIEHCLLAVPGAAIGGIKNVFSHPHGFPQCSVFLEQHPEWKLVECESTADAAVRVAQAGSPENAAIASELAGQYNGLTELARGIESNPGNYTRFVVLAHEGTEKDAGGEFMFSGDMTKGSIIFITKNKPGALYGCLGVFHKNALNLTRLESRPVPGEPWRHSFYADIDVTAPGPGGGIQRSRQIVESVLGDLRAKTEEIRLLGLYRERDC